MPMNTRARAKRQAEMQAAPSPKPKIPAAPAPEKLPPSRVGGVLIDLGQTGVWSQCHGVQWTGRWMRAMRVRCHQPSHQFFENAVLCNAAFLCGVFPAPPCYWHPCIQQHCTHATLSSPGPYPSLKHIYQSIRVLLLYQYNHDKIVKYCCPATSLLPHETY